MRTILEMSLRDYFAGLVLLGVMTCEMGFDGNDEESHTARTARKCYEFADEMLKSRDKNR